MWGVLYPKIKGTKEWHMADSSNSMLSSAFLNELFKTSSLLPKENEFFAGTQLLANWIFNREVQYIMIFLYMLIQKKPILLFISLFCLIEVQLVELGIV